MLQEDAACTDHRLPQRQRVLRGRGVRLGGKLRARVRAATYAG
jgi:hypothetical protein